MRYHSVVMFNTITSWLSDLSGNLAIGLKIIICTSERGDDEAIMSTVSSQ